MCNDIILSNTTTPVYLGIHLDRTQCYKTHTEKTNMKVNARISSIRKLASSKWGCKATTLRPRCLALCYSAAEYTWPVWARSTHAHKLNPALHDCCRIGVYRWILPTFVWPGCICDRVISVLANVSVPCCLLGKELARRNHDTCRLSSAVLCLYRSFTTVAWLESVSCRITSIQR